MGKECELTKLMRGAWFIALYLLLMALSSCGGGGSDSQSPVSTEQNVTITVAGVDGPLALASLRFYLLSEYLEFGGSAAELPPADLVSDASGFGQFIVPEALENEDLIFVVQSLSSTVDTSTNAQPVIEEVKTIIPASARLGQNLRFYATSLTTLTVELAIQQLAAENLIAVSDVDPSELVSRIQQPRFLAHCDAEVNQLAQLQCQLIHQKPVGL